MPREYKTRVPAGGGREAINPQPTGQQIAPQVVANPVATPVAPDENSFEASILRGLEKLNPALSAWNEQAAQLARADASRRLEEERRQGTVEGAAARVRGDALPQEATPEYRQGYMLTAAKNDGARDGMEFEQLAEQNRDNPEFDAAAESQKFIAERMKGVDDPHYVTAYQQSVQGSVARVQAKHAEYQLALQRKNAVDAHEMALFNVAQLPGTAVDRHEGFAIQARAARTNGITWDASADGFVTSMVTRAKGELNEEYLNELYVHSPMTNGVAPGQDPKRNARIEAARAEIRSALQRNTGRAIDVATAVKKSEFDRMVDQDPLAFRDEAGFLQAAMQFALAPGERPGAPGKWITSNEDLAGYISRFRDSKAKADEKVRNERTWETEPRSMLGTPAGEDRARASFGAIWQNVDWANPQAISDAFAQSIRETSRTAHADPHLKGLVDVTTMSLDRIDGKVPEQFTRAASLYQTLRERGEEGLLAKALNEDSRAVLERFYDGRTQDQLTPELAFKEAIKALNPEERRRVTMVVTPQATAQIDQEFKALVSRGFFRPLTSTGEESSDYQMEFRQKVSRYVERGMRLEAATKAAKEEFSARLQWDGHSNYILLPNIPEVLAQKEQLGVAVKGRLEELLSVPAYAGAKFKVDVSVDGNRFTAVDPQTGRVEVLGSRQEMLQEYKKKEFTTPEKRAEIDSFVRDFRQGKLTEEQVYSRLPELRQARSVGMIRSAREFEDMETMARRHQTKSSLAAASAVAAMMASFGQTPPPPTPEQLSAIRSVPVPQPGNGAPTVKDLVGQYATRNPTFALIAAIEGYDDKAYADIGGNRTIGLGYNMSSREPRQVRLDLARAGVAPHLVDDVVAGKARMTSEQVFNLTNHLLDKEYLPKAKAAVEKVYGVGAWEMLPAERQAVITYLGWNTGNPGQFHDTLVKLKEGDVAGAAQGLKVFARNSSTNQMQRLTRAEGLMRAMMYGPDNFLTYFNGGADPRRSTGPVTQR